MTFDLEYVVPGVVSLLAMTGPFSPVKAILFNDIIANPPRDRKASALRVSLYTILIIGTTALFGRELMNLLGIDLSAFQVVGGLIVTAIGVEMLYGGSSSKSNGGDVEKEVADQGSDAADALFIPMTMPMVAGPGTIATTMTIASRGENGEGVVAALVGAVAVAVGIFITLGLFSEQLAKVRPATIAIITRIGGLLTMTIGAQMFMTAVKAFFFE